MRRISFALLSSVWFAFAPVAFALPFSGLYVFGDSLSDPGNVFAKTGGTFPPSPPYVAGHFSNGPTAAEYFAAQLGLSGAQVSNFAEGGATTNTFNTNDPDGSIGLFGLKQQIDGFAASAPAAGGADPNALYMLWAGANNFLGGVIDPVAAITAAVTDIGASVGTLIALGAQNVVVLNLPDFGAVPANNLLEPDVVARASALSVGFNATLAQALTGLDQASPSARIVQFDIFALLNEVIASPVSFGFSNVTEGCIALDFSSVCTDAENRVFWDGLHPTTRAHFIIASRLNEEIPEPASMALMSLGLLIFVTGFARRRQAQSLEPRRTRRTQRKAAAVL